MKTLHALLFGLLLCNGAVANESDFKCMKSVGLKNPIRLQFTFPAENQDIGYVMYQKGSEPIPVKRIKEETIREVPGGRPWVFQSVWEEITDSGIGGKYVIVSQGAIIYEFKYMRKDGKVFKFEDAFEASTENGCRWDN